MSSVVRTLGLALLLAAVGCGDDPASGHQVADGGYWIDDGGVVVWPDGATCDPAREWCLGDAGFAPDGQWFEECTAVAESAKPLRGPADIVIAIDNTPSMENEIAEVRANMNRLSAMVAAKGLDLNIVLVSCLTEDCLRQSGWFTICVDPPVGSGACPADDSNPPNYLHVNQRIESLKALQRVVGTYAQWSSMIRDHSAKHVLVVSDDSDEWTAAQFTDALVAADARFQGYRFHGIFSYTSKEAACAAAGDPCCTYAAPSGEGIPYRDLVTQTGGVSGNLCEQEFDPVFDALAGAVIASAALSCEWQIPAPPAGETLDPTKVNVEFIDASNVSHLIGAVPGAEQCALVAQGWYYDDPTAPTKVVVCPQTCTWIQGETGAEMKVHFGCLTEQAPIE
jgi:hypothetical protein